MTRQQRIILAMVYVLTYAWLAYFNFGNARQDGLPTVTAALAIPTFGPALTAITQLTTLWSLLKRRSYEAFLLPTETILIDEGRISHSLDVCLFVAMTVAAILTWPGLGTWHNLFDNPLWNIAFFAIGASGFVSLLSMPRLRITIAPEGIEVSRLKPSRVPWRDISDAKIQKVVESATITLRLRDESVFRSASLLWRWRQASAVSIFPTKLGIDPDRLFEAIELRRMTAPF